MDQRIRRAAEKVMVAAATVAAMEVAGAFAACQMVSLEETAEAE